jgi:hypothetical protein
MAQSEGISLRDALASEVPESGAHIDHEEEASDGDRDLADPRQHESIRTRACVLLGSAMLQFPIWGRH